MALKIFVTGHCGYIGAHLVELLKEAGYSVTGCDLKLFEDCQWEPLVEPDVELVKDIRDVTARELEGHDAICHLAAISNDPMGDLDPQITHQINRIGSIKLARQAKLAGVGRFLFSGSCSIYGQGQKSHLDESDPLRPLSAYAETKIDAEKFLAELADTAFAPVYLRNATAYGHSPMLRIDLVVNNLLGSALAYNQIRIQSDGSPWRPLIHCRDIARAFVALLAAPRELICNEAINVGCNTENYQVKDIGGLVKQLIPDATIIYTGEVGKDPRNYRVNFDKFNRLLPDFTWEYTLSSGMDELHRKMVEHKFDRTCFESDKFVRLRTLKTQLDRLRDLCHTT